MESILQQFGSLDLLPVFINVSHAITQPFVHSFQVTVPAFVPYLKTWITNEPGLIGGVFFVLLSYSFVILVQNSKKARVAVSNKKMLQN